MTELLLDAGRAWIAFTARPGTARVIASFPRAAYLQAGEQVVALVAPDVARGPLHARVASLPALGDRLKIEDLMIGSTWRPPSIDGARLLRVGRSLSDSLTIADRSPLAGEPLLVSGVEDLVVALAGRGPGLTPAGDDVLAGVLLVHALTGVDRAALAALVKRASTHAISRAFLAAAAQGESIELVHHLLVVLADGRLDELERWQAVLAGIGGTSGCDLVLGVRIALQNGRSASQIA